MHLIYQRFCSLLAASINATGSILPSPLSGGEWENIYRISIQQGVLAVVYDAVKRLPGNLQPDRDVRMAWAFNVDRIEKRYDMQFLRADELARIYAQHGIRTVVLKGIGIGMYYPVPRHRECGDFDCFLCGDYERGNALAAKYGAKVSDCGYKHSHIEYKGLTVENHRYCIGIRGSKVLQEMETYLQSQFSAPEKCRIVPDSELLLPPADFNALFLIQHASQHFLIEGITIRHVCDWAFFLKHEQNSVDWPQFYRLCRKCNLKKFADALTAICVEKLGLELTNPAIQTDSSVAKKVFENVMYGQERVYSSGKGLWGSRIIIVKNFFNYRWKYKEVYNKNWLWELLRTSFFTVFNPM